MLLSEYYNNNLSSYMKAERYVNSGSPSGFSEINTTSESTKPKSGTKEFDVLEIKFSEDVHTEDFGSISNYIELYQNSMLVHMDLLESSLLANEKFDIVRRIPVEPTSSGRTVLMKNKRPCFIKMAYPDFLGRVRRHMRKEHVLSAMEVSSRLQKAVDDQLIGVPFAFLRENAGRVIRLPKSGYEWGVIFREYIPYPFVDMKEFYIPFFSLFGYEVDPMTGKEKCNKDPSLLYQLYEKQTDSPEEFLLNKIIFPLCKVYFDVLLKTGIELEAHAQNMLLTVDEKFQIQRIVCRDLESAGRDVTLMQRQEIQYNLDNMYKCNMLMDEIYDKYPKWYINHSFMFDFKLGEYILTPMLECAKECFENVNIEEMQRRIKMFNQQFVKQLPDFFPSEWCYYENINFEEKGLERKYIWLSNPKCR